jgi:hypothetical protein
MAGLDPAIHAIELSEILVGLRESRYVDARNKSGQDGEEGCWLATSACNQDLGDLPGG